MSCENKIVSNQEYYCIMILTASGFCFSSSLTFSTADWVWKVTEIITLNKECI